MQTLNTIITIGLWFVLIGNLLAATRDGILASYYTLKERHSSEIQFHATLTTMHLAWAIVAFLLLK